MASETELERMMVRLLGDASSYNKMLSDAVKDTSRATASIQQTAGKIGQVSGAVNGFANSVAGYAGGILSVMGLGSAFDTAKRAFSLAAEAEENEVAFGVMLQNAEKGKQMVRDLQAFAAATPLDTSTLQGASKTLLQFGVEGENILPILKMLGDVTGGNSAKIQQMSLAFGQMSSTGRLMGQDLLQMINAGFNPLKEISRTTGKSVSELKKEMEKGAISADMVTMAFKSATSEGGNFQGLMEKQSKTVSGLISTMQDDISSSLRVIGKDLIDNLNLKGIIQDVSAVAQGFTSWLNSLSSGTKTAIASILAVVAAVGVLTIGMVILGKAITFATGGLSVIGALLAAVFIGAAA